MIEHVPCVSPVRDITVHGPIDVRVVFQDFGGFLIEAVDVHQHPVVSGSKKITALREQAVQSGAAVFQTGGQVLHAERHVGVLLFNIQGLEKFEKVRIRHMIENHEGRIDVDVVSVVVDRQRVRMPAGVIFLVKKSDVVFMAQKVTRCHSRHARPDDRNFIHV